MNADTGAAVVVLATAGLVAAGWGGVRVLHPRYVAVRRVRVLRARLRCRLWPGPGFASVLALWLWWGRFAGFRRSGRVRPALSTWERMRRPGAYSLFLGRAQYRHGLRLPLDEHAAAFGPPREGKTGWLARTVMHHPGPVVSTTTKADIYALTAAIRAASGPVHVFSPQGIGGLASTFSWDPVAGCTDPAVAIRRADAFAHAVSQKGVEDGSFWSSKASDYLRACFHAAALGGLDLRAVAAWVIGGDASGAVEILAANGAMQWAGQLAELNSDAQKTAATVRMTMSRAMAFLADPHLAECVLPGYGEDLDIESFLRSCGALYLVAEHQGESAPLGPLFVCLASEIHWQACLTGGQSRGGRLDPPLLMALDEVTQICPVPLPQWLADSGGKGIQIIPVCHGLAQLAERWGRDGRQIVLDTCSARVFLPGLADMDTLRMASELCGRVAMRERGREDEQRAWHDVITPDMVRMLPGNRALVIRGRHAPVIAQLPLAWKDPAYKRARRRGLAGLAPMAAAAPAPAEVVADAVPAPSNGHRHEPPGQLMPHLVPDVEPQAGDEQ